MADKVEVASNVLEKIIGVIRTTPRPVSYRPLKSYLFSGKLSSVWKSGKKKWLRFGWPGLAIGRKEVMETITIFVAAITAMMVTITRPHSVRDESFLSGGDGDFPVPNCRFWPGRALIVYWFIYLCRFPRPLVQPVIPVAPPPPTHTSAIIDFLLSMIIISAFSAAQPPA